MGVKYTPKSYPDGRGIYQEISYNPLANFGSTGEEIEASYAFPKEALV